jgi:hypothetical protein
MTAAIREALDAYGSAEFAAGSGTVFSTHAERAVIQKHIVALVAVVDAAELVSDAFGDVPPDSPAFYRAMQDLRTALRDVSSLNALAANVVTPP